MLADPLWDNALGLTAIATLIPAVLLVAVLVERRSAGSLLSVTGRLRVRWLGWCALVATPLTAAVLLADVLLSRDDEGYLARWTALDPWPSRCWCSYRW